MWIETLFRDWQSGGFDLGKIGIPTHERFNRLIILVGLAYRLRDNLPWLGAQGGDPPVPPAA